jgi:hypothetical protein
MAKKAQTQPSSENKHQLAAFRKAAREVGADDNEERFKEALRKVAKHKPQAEKKSNVTKAKTLHSATGKRI